MDELTYCKSDVSSPDGVSGDPTIDRIDVVSKTFSEQSSANEFRLFYNEFKILKLIKEQEEKEEKEGAANNEYGRDDLIDYIGYIHIKSTNRPLSLALVFKLDKYLDLYEYSSEINGPHKKLWKKLNKGKISLLMTCELKELKLKWGREIQDLNLKAWDIARGGIY
jgi:hypothetical protein